MKPTVGLRQYHVDGQRTADIFQNSGEYLPAFVDKRSRA